MCRIWKLYERRWNASFCWTVHLHFDNAKTFLCDWWSHRIRRSNGNRRENTRLHDKMFRMQQPPQPPYSGSDSFQTEKRISPVDLIQWIKRNIYWNSFSQRIHQKPFTHVHLARTHTQNTFYCSFGRPRLIARFLFSLTLLCVCCVCASLFHSSFVYYQFTSTAIAVNLQSFCHVFVI